MSRPEHPVYAFSHDLVERYAALRPSTATMWGLSAYDHLWEDLSPAGVEAWRAMVQQTRADLAALPATDDRWAAVAVEVIETWTAQELAILDSGQPYRWLSHIASPFEGIHLTLSHMDPVTQAEAIVARLEGIPDLLQGYRASLAHGLSIGERASARQVRSCIEQGESLLEHRLLDVLGPTPESDRAHQAYSDFTDWLRHTYLPASDPTDGIGEARYLPAARGFLLLDLDLDATYAWGWSLIEELHVALNELLERLVPGKTLAQAVEHWRTAPASTADDPEAFLTQIRAWQDEAFASLGHLFPTPPVTRQISITRAPRGLPPGAWYLTPSEDGARPGKVQYSLRDGRVPLFDQQSTACHEGFPGHHLQLSLQTTLSGNLSRFHRLAFHCIGFAEGWALYAERVVDEQGAYASDLQRAGYLVNQLARACRVVLDIGLHTGRPIPSDVFLPADPSTGIEPGADWTYERAVAFMTAIGGLRREVSESEITRYLGWPGQAISYSVGMKALLDLRARFLATGGTLPAFHERVLGLGTIGLGRLEQAVLGSPDEDSVA